MSKLGENFINAGPDRNSGDAIRALGVTCHDEIAAVHALHILLSDENGARNNEAALQTIAATARPLQLYDDYASDFFKGSPHDKAALRIALILGPYAGTLLELRTRNDDQGENGEIRSALKERCFYDKDVVARAAALHNKMYTRMSVGTVPENPAAHFLGYADLIVQLENRKHRNNPAEAADLARNIQPYKNICPDSSEIGQKLHGLFGWAEKRAKTAHANISEIKP